jgi:hypothetical protein
MFRILIALLTVGAASTMLYAANDIQTDFDKKFVGYKMDPFILQESQECLLKPYVPMFGTQFDIFRGSIYNSDKTTGTTK